MSQALTILLPDVSGRVTIAAEWFEQRDALLAGTAAITAVADALSCDRAGEAIRRLAKAAKALEDQRKQITEPFLRAQKLIKAKADEALAPVGAETVRLKVLVAAFAAEEGRRAEAAAWAAEAARRLEIERQLAQQQAEADLFPDNPVPAEIVVPAAAPEPVRPKVEGADCRSADVHGHRRGGSPAAVPRRGPEPHPPLPAREQGRLHRRPQGVPRLDAHPGRGREDRNQSCLTLNNGRMHTMAKLLNFEGTFQVTLRNAHWTRLQEKDGDARRMSAVLPGYVTVGGEEFCVTAEMMFTRTLISKGRNAGRSVAQVSMQTLAELGMPVDADGLINPARLTAELEGKQAKFVCEFEEYEGQNRLRVKFVNSPGRAELAPEEKNLISHRAKALEKLVRDLF